MRNILCATTAAVFAAFLPAAGPALAASPDAAARLVGRAVGDTPLLADTRELCDTVGGRPARGVDDYRPVQLHILAKRPEHWIESTPARTASFMATGE